MDYQRYSISSRILNLICVLIIQHQHIHGSVTLTVSPSGDVEVNQTVTIQCSFELNPIVAIFYSSRNPTSQFCDLEPSGGVCKPNTCSRNYVTTCPNDTTYSVQYPVPQSWNGASVYCVGLSGVERSNQVAFSVTVLVTSLTLTPVQISVDVSAYTNLMCRTDYCNPAATITWYKSSTVISSQITSTTDSNSEGLHRTTSVLTYTGVAGDNGQQVYCRASNRQGVYVESNKDILDVRYPPLSDPVITASPSGLQYDNGTSVSLTCELSGGNPVATLSWRCKGVDMTGTNQSSTTTAISLLSLLMDSSYNNKQCTCTANHRLLTSTKSESVLLTVFYNNVILSSLNKEYVINEYGRLQIKCDVDGNPLSTITWMFVQNNTAVKRDSNVNSSTLDISSANCLDHGSYKVTAENGKGPAAVKTTHVVVRCKPQLYNINSQSPDKLVIRNGDSLQILVRILLYPPATLTQWIFTGKNNTSEFIPNNTADYRITDARGDIEQNITLYKSRINTEDFGDYIIMVQNDIGTFLRIYHVNTARIQDSVENQTGVAVGSAVGIVTFIIIIIVLVVFLRRRYTFICIIKFEKKNIDKRAEMTDATKDECSMSMAEQNVQRERSLYEEVTERDNVHQYEGLSIKDKLGSEERQTYESIQGSSVENKYEKLSTVADKQDDDDEDPTSPHNPPMSTPVDVYINTSFQK